MVLKPELIQAFAALEISSDADESIAARAYKRLALLHHPDRNHGDSTATQRFQQLGAAWNTCKRYYENPAWGHVPEPSLHGGYGASWDDDDVPMDDDDMDAFFRYMFEEMLFNRYSRAKGQYYRSQRSGGEERGLYTFSGGFAETQERQSANEARQEKNNKAYEKRIRELELEIEAELREKAKLEREKQAAEKRRASALQQAFKSAREGNAQAVRDAVLEYNLDVNTPLNKLKQAKKQETEQKHESLLHVAASFCGEELVSFLLEKGALSTTLNNASLTPFHAAILAGNAPVVRLFLSRRTKFSEGCHPSKATADGRTPLQLAVISSSPAMVELLVKEATVHDVERWWKSDNVSQEIKDILQTKKGFAPPDEVNGSSTATSQQARNKLEAARKAAEEKAAKIAEEKARAAENLRKKQERAERRAAEERQKMEARQRLEEEDRAKAEEEACLKAAQEARSKTEQEAQAKAEEETRVKAERERSKLEAEQRARGEAQRKAQEEAQKRAQEEADRRARLEAQRRAQQEALQQAEQEVQERAQQEVQEQALQEAEERAMQAEMEAQEEKKARREKEKAEEEARLQTESAKARREKKLQSRLNGAPQTANQGTRLAKPVKKARRELDSSAQDMPATRTPDVVQEEVAGAPMTKRVERIQEYKARMKERQQQDKKTREIPTEDMDKYEVIMQRRAEQSARDKERHRRMMEEKAKLKESKDGMDGRSVDGSEGAKKKSVNKRNGVPGASAPRQAVTPPALVIEVPSLGPEDIQTCFVPDDLFRDEKRPSSGSAAVTDMTVASSQSQSKGEDGVGRGRGLWRGRGRGRGRGFWRGRGVRGAS